MGLITISGQPGCRHEEIARLTAQALEFELVTEARLGELLEEEFGQPVVPDKAFRDAVLSILARLAAQHHLVVAADGAELMLKDFPGSLRVAIVAPEPHRLGTLMLELRLDRAAARQALRQLETEQKARRRIRFGRGTAPAHLFDVALNTEFLEPERAVEAIRGVVNARGLIDQGLLSAAAEAHIGFQARLRLSRFGIVAPAKASLKKRNAFVHPSEEVFANLLDFYRVAWEYEPRTFPIQWDPDGRVLESFTPDFYLPEFNLYVELTTMKQSLVTKKNRKVKLLRMAYPNVNIQVFYQKDFENLIFKYGLAERAGKPEPAAR